MERPDRVEAALTERELEQLLVSAPANLRWLCGFAGSNAMCLVGMGGRLFFTDFRYLEWTERELPDWERVRAERDLLDDVCKRFRGRVGFDDAHLSVRQLRRLEERSAGVVELVPAGGLVEELRRHKDASELAAMRAAANLADDAYRWTCERGLGGRSEREVARSAEARIRELDADPAFPVIVAAGPNGALPHAEPGERTIQSGDLVVFDMGALVDGYCSDCTRTFAIGEPEEDARAVYALVYEAQGAALERVRAGVPVGDVDAAARDRIALAGHGEEFGHPTGHGVGLEVHEAPRLGAGGTTELVEGEAVTVEPGVYVAGRFGVRIEDLVVVTADGHESLSSLSKELTTIE